MHVLKKVATVAAIAAGFMMAGSPAFATSGEPHYYGYGYGDVPGVEWLNYEDNESNTADQVGLINLNDSELLSDVYLCGLEVIPIVPILSESDTITCYSEDENETAIVGNETDIDTETAAE
ncbi:hypothetical protein JOF41_007018 [Saccharothrix coeruleofusca]|uniref:hypothetical protein n=1 Tax=Saccharothrix coeruleofusca TaxID=33919 RepID=UPI001AE4F112|nr:hypothetical protein [Saccharothrix coeruleofusca]MBP2340840.1 hypothetical protein [Saccharothrix coeruleofusca]